MAPFPDPPEQVRQLAQQLAEPKPMRRGSISVRSVKCGKPGCACAERAEARHGPYVSLVRVVGGKTESRWVAPQQVETLRRQVEAGQGFRQQLEVYWRACEAWADAELAPPEAPAQGAEKRGSKKRSTKRSSPKSRPS
jgi:hypothetical protein